MHVIFVLLAAIRGHPNGQQISCTDGTYTIPLGIDSSPETVTTACSGYDCTTQIQGKNTKGFVISTTHGTISTATAHVSKNSNRCILHSNNNQKTSVGFTWSPGQGDTFTTIFITLVSGKNEGNHKVGYNLQRLSNVGTVYVVGAGPGGLAAARWIHANFPNSVLKVYERGHDPGVSWYTRPISETASKNMTHNVMQSSSTEYNLASMVGGQQNINGAVYAPGTPEALAGSLEIDVSEARSLQNTAGTYVHHEDHMMWKCINPPDCDSLFFAQENAKMARRSIAYDLPDDIDLETQADVQYVNDTAITFKNDTVVPLQQNDKVILAAGALVSPQLLGKTEFDGWNHYYYADVHGPAPPSFDPNNPPATSTEQFVTRQTFLYPDSVRNATEINKGGIANEVYMEINMSMLPSVREHHVVGGNYTNPYPDPTFSQAWHFAGTMNHNRSKIDGFDRLFTGDAGALKTPFNCHTSMPAAAAGILAAHAAMDVPLGALDDAVPSAAIKPPEPTTEELVVTYAWVSVLAIYVVSDVPFFLPESTRKTAPIEYATWGRLVF